MGTVIPIVAHQLDTVSNRLHTLVMSIPISAFDPMAAYSTAAARNANSKPTRGVPFEGCERPTVPAPAPKPLSRAKRIRSYMEDSGMSRAEARAMVDFEGE